MFKAVLFMTCVITYSQARNCREDGTILALKKPAYEFSVGFLDRISYGITEHFVYSPLSTWLQLILLADGARKVTLNEIWNITGLLGFRKKTCYRRKLKEIINDMEDDSVIRSSVVIIDKFYKFNRVFKNKAESLNNVKLLSLDFKDANNSADIANDILENNNDIFYNSLTFIPEDFDKRVLLMADLTYLESAWKHPFVEAQTKSAPFYAEMGNKIIGEVDMMNQVGYFKESEIASINARVLELPFVNERFSMLIYYLPTKGNKVSDIYYSLRNTTLTTVIYSLTKEAKAVNVSLPKFDIITEISNIPELLYDMGMNRAFYPDLADLEGITDSGDINVSWMSQVAMIDVTESQVGEAGNIAENVITDAADFNVNKPFAFMLVDKKTEFILFAGIYSNPNERQPTN